MTSIPPPNDSIHVKHCMEGPLPLSTKSLSWPAQTLSLCLHCAGDCCRGPPLPATKYFDPQKQHYWIFGPFCSPECVFGYLCEQKCTSKQIALSHTVLRDFFGISKVVIGPPRTAHARFGGTVSDSEFHGAFHDTKDLLEPPFVTFASYVMAVHEAEGRSFDVHACLPQSAGKLSGLKRPETRATPLAKKEETGCPVLLLNYLATLKDKKRKAEEEPKKPSGSLAKYLKTS